MRKWQQKQIFEIIGNLDELHQSIQKCIENSNYETALMILTDCQESSISVGTAIEEIEGENCLTVRYLEEYCENLYTISQGFGQTTVNSSDWGAKDIFELLYKGIERIKKSLTEDIVVRKEVVFFPYKASMWDSLESIYLAAKEDPDCDAYCVPIPYFDKNPDGSFREMHYEGMEYPMGIEITPWETYSFEERRPDAIYIHNPYDGWNIVTSVHPRYYASNLCKFTDILVYVPYFVLNEIEPSDQNAIESMKHFCFLPGTVYANKVILQSENMRQIYINECMKEWEKQGKKIDRLVLEERFLGIGSPKFDRVEDKRKEDIAIPEEWKKLIIRSEGGLKKIILYNTSVGALLRHNEKMIDKIKIVFSIFKDMDETILWWRPHPLIEATISAMRPDLWAQYEELVRQYREEGWGIYDDTPDVQRAINISDAYYGDRSSLVTMYKETGKAIMLQNAEVLSKNNLLGLVYGTYQEDDDIWFIEDVDNKLCYMNLNRRIIKDISVVPTEGEDTFRMNSRCVKHREFIFCLPDRAEKIYIYDTYENEFEYCELNNPEGVRVGIYNSWKEDSTLWCVAYGLSQIVEIDLDKRVIVAYYNLFESVNELVGYEATKKKDYIYCVSKNSTMICKFDTINKSMKYFNLLIDEKGLNTIAVDGDEFYLTGYSKRIYIWNENTNEIQMLSNFPGKYMVYGSDGEEINNLFYNMPLFYRSIVTKKNIIFLPWNCTGTISSGLIVFDKKSNKIETFVLCDETKGANGYYSVCYMKPEGRVGIFSSKLLDIFEIDIRDNTVKNIGFKRECNEILMRSLIERKNIIEEAYSNHLEHFLKIFYTKNEIGIKPDNAGYIIWKNILD